MEAYYTFFPAPFSSPVFNCFRARDYLVLKLHLKVNLSTVKYVQGKIKAKHESILKDMVIVQVQQTEDQ